MIEQGRNTSSGTVKDSTRARRYGTLSGRLDIRLDGADDSDDVLIPYGDELVCGLRLI